MASLWIMIQKRFLGNLEISMDSRRVTRIFLTGTNRTTQKITQSYSKNNNSEVMSLRVMFQMNCSGISSPFSKFSNASSLANSQAWNSAARSVGSSLGKRLSVCAIEDGLGFVMGRLYAIPSGLGTRCGAGLQSFHPFGILAIPSTRTGI